MESGVFAQIKGKGTWFFYPVWRNESCICFEYRMEDGGELEELNAIVFVPNGHDYEVAGPIEWQGRMVFLEATPSATIMRWFWGIWI